MHCTDFSCSSFCTLRAVILYRTKNRNRTIGSHVVDKILNGSAVITCMLSSSQRGRRFLNRPHLAYMNINHRTRKNKCMPDILESKSTQKYQV